MKCFIKITAPKAQLRVSISYSKQPGLVSTLIYTVVGHQQALLLYKYPHVACRERVELLDGEVV